jgi:hypothetical protein
MANPSQMFDHTLDAVKGWFHEAALDNSAKLSANVTIDPFEQGRVVHLNASKEYESGVKNANMAIFLLNSSNDPDVANPGGDYWQAIAPTGKMSGLVATGAYELESSEYRSAGTYNPGQLLAAEVANTTAATGGVLSDQDDAAAALTLPWLGNHSGTDQAVCGVVSTGINENSHGVNVLRFWPVYLPGES